MWCLGVDSLPALVCCPLQRCVDAAIRAMGIRRVPELFPPVAYSRLPTRLFSTGTDTGLAFQVNQRINPAIFVCVVVVVVVVVDSHIQRIVLATEETTVTQQVSHRPIKCQSRLWSQRGTKVHGSHHGDNPLLRPTGIQIATKSYAALQAMAPTNIKTVHQTGCGCVYQ